MTVFLAFLVSTAFAQDDEILAVGHPAFMARFEGIEAKVGGERQFALALGYRNLREISASPHKSHFDEMLTLTANMSKGACRVADYLTIRMPEGELWYAKAQTLANLTISTYVHAKAPAETVSQTTFWQSYRQGREFHIKNAEKIEAFRRANSGYTAEHTLLSFEGLGKLAYQMFRLSSKRPEAARQNVILLCHRLIRLTMGQDPLPYGPSQ